MNRQEINNKFADILDRKENKNKSCTEIVVEQDLEIEKLNKIIQELEDEIMIIFKNRLESHELNVEHYKEKIKDYERWFKELKEKE